MYVKVRSVDVGRVGVCMMCIDSEEHENVGAGQTLGLSITGEKYTVASM